MSNSLIVGYSSADESRGDVGTLFPMVDMLQGGSVYTTFGSEPFTPNNELYYKTFQLQDSFTKYGEKHSFTGGVSYENYKSTNVFFPGKQSAYIYNSLADFYTDARDALANPNRTTSPVTLARFQVRYSNIPGQEKPVQPLEVQYIGGYAQDEWTMADNIKVIAGIRGDVAIFGDTAYDNALADALNFRDETGATVQYDTGKLPDSKILWSPRVGFNWDVDQQPQHAGARRFGHLHRQAGLRVDLEPDRQHRRADRLHRSDATPRRSRSARTRTSTSRPTSPARRPPAYELNVTDDDFKFPQIWRTNVGLDQRLPWGITGTAEVIYSKDVNGMYYINANLPAAQTCLQRRRQASALHSEPHQLQRGRQLRAEEPGLRQGVDASRVR